MMIKTIVGATVGWLIVSVLTNDYNIVFLVTFIMGCTLGYQIGRREKEE